MNSASLWLLLLLTISMASAFVGYWYGVGVAEKRHKVREARLIEDLDQSVATIQRLCRERHPVGKERRLTLVQGGAS